MTPTPAVHLNVTDHGGGDLVATTSVRWDDSGPMGDLVANFEIWGPPSSIDSTSLDAPLLLDGLVVRGTVPMAVEIKDPPDQDEIGSLSPIVTAKASIRVSRREIRMWPRSTYSIRSTVTAPSGWLHVEETRATYEQYKSHPIETVAEWPISQTTLTTILNRPEDRIIDSLPFGFDRSRVLLAEDPAWTANDLVAAVTAHVQRRDPLASIFSPLLRLDPGAEAWPTAAHRLNAHTREAAAIDGAIALQALRSAHEDNADGEADPSRFQRPLEAAVDAARLNPDDLHAMLAMTDALVNLGDDVRATLEFGTLVGKLLALEQLLTRSSTDYHWIAHDILQESWSERGRSLLITLAPQCGFHASLNALAPTVWQQPIPDRPGS
ncbi:MAG: hypothetical protein GY720_17880 [bacterium]|nr:hypothetical protein [bacterium]